MAFSSHESASVFAASSGSYQLNGAVQSGDTFSSSSYSLCSRFGSTPTSGSSTSYVLTPHLYCNESTIGGGGGGGGGGWVRRAECGNGYVEFGEQCDDGNLVNGDGCSSACMIEEVSQPPVIPPEPLPEPDPETDPDPETEPGVETPVPSPEPTPEFPSAPETPVVPVDEEVQPPVIQPVPDADPGLSPFFPGSLFPICGNGFVEIGEQCDDGNLLNGDGCSSTCRVETLLFPAPFSPVPLTTPAVPREAPSFDIPSGVDLGQTYLTNDIETLFFEQFEGGIGEYEIFLTDREKSYEIAVLKTTSGYFSFQLQEDLPDGFYVIRVVDLHLNQTLYLSLQVEEKEKIDAPLLTHLDDWDLASLDSLEGLTVMDLQPVLRGTTHLPATIAFYSSQLQQTFIVYTDENNAFEFRYPEKLVAGVFEELRIIAHYENGHVSRPQIMRFEVLELPHFVADENSFIQSPLFSYLGIVLLFVISTLSSLYFFGFQSSFSSKLKKSLNL